MIDIYTKIKNTAVKQPTGIWDEGFGLESQKVVTNKIKNNMQYSFTYIGIIIIILTQFGIPETDVTVTIKTISTIVGAIIAFWGRYKAGGISILGVKSKKSNE